MTERKPLALANWKMAMTLSESMSFIHRFEAAAGAFTDAMDIVICPPYTALATLSAMMREKASKLQLGAQNVAASIDLARTGEISATLLADAGCRWVMLGHWEVRRYEGDNDVWISRKVRLALAAGLRPIVLIGESRDDTEPVAAILRTRLLQILAGCEAADVAQMAFVYEPEGAVGGSVPASPEHVSQGCNFIRAWIRQRFGDATAEQVRVIYGGSVAPGFAPDLLSCPDVDGLGASRRGRDPDVFLSLVQRIADARVRDADAD